MLHYLLKLTFHSIFFPVFERRKLESDNFLKGNSSFNMYYVAHNSRRNLTGACKRKMMKFYNKIEPLCAVDMRKWMA